jgi:hypothetical protein
MLLAVTNNLQLLNLNFSVDNFSVDFIEYL